MASKIHTDNPKHHKYITVNKKERKKNTINVIFNHITKIYNCIYNIIDDWYNIKFKIYGEHPIYHGTKDCIIIYDDCNHKTYRVYNKKTHKFINTLDKSKGYGHFCFTPKHFNR
ncbi:MAG: hypothetical protein J6M39_06645 [Lachnospiraceae bacterium]|nr:hypothetical protein [Lachnospiraceae bacterium]